MKNKLLLTILSITLLLSGCSITEKENVIVKVPSTNTENKVSSELIYDTEEIETEQQIIETETEEKEPEVQTVNIKMVGDCLIHSSLYKSAEQSPGLYNFDSMFEHVKNDIESADIAIINQETIFTANINDYSGYPMFGSPIEVGIAEVNAGFDVVCHATNHTIDKGIQGIEDTLQFWNENYPEIGILGIHNNEDESDIYYKETNGINFAFVNYTYGLNGLESRRTGKEYIVDMLTDSDIEETLAEAEENSDMTIAILHVGTEYVYEPTDYAKQQVDKFIDNGADIVICAHPHVIEPYEMRTTDNGKTGLVYYSLGNFISAQDEYPRVLGGMADITITKTTYNNESTIEITDYTMIPLVTHQERGYYTTYKLEDYTDELASKHRLGITTEKLWTLWNSIISKNVYDN